MNCPLCGCGLTNATRIKPGVDQVLVRTCISGMETMMEAGVICGDMACSYESWGPTTKKQDHPEKRLRNELALATRGK